MCLSGTLIERQVHSWVHNVLQKAVIIQLNGLISTSEMTVMELLQSISEVHRCTSLSVEHLLFSTSKSLFWVFLALWGEKEALINQDPRQSFCLWMIRVLTSDLDFIKKRAVLFKWASIRDNGNYFAKTQTTAGCLCYRSGPALLGDASPNTNVPVSLLSQRFPGHE